MEINFKDVQFTKKEIALMLSMRDIDKEFLEEYSDTPYETFECVWNNPSKCFKQAASYPAEKMEERINLVDKLSLEIKEGRLTPDEALLTMTYLAEDIFQN
jgi:hypothetical protein